MIITIGNVTVRSTDTVKAEEWQAEIQLNNGGVPLKLSLLQARKVYSMLGFILGVNNDV